MKRINVLVTAVGGPTALGILKCLQNIDYIRLVGTDSQRDNAGNKFCDKLYCVPRITNVEDYKKEISQIVESEKIDVIFPTLQDEIVIYQEFKEQVQAEVALPKSEYFDILVDKEKLYMYLENTSLKKFIPAYQVFENNHELEEIVNKHFSKDEYVCVKGVQGHGGLGVAILTNRENYLQAMKSGESKIYNITDYYDLNSNDRRMVMEYLNGLEYSVDVLLHRGEVLVAVPRKRNRVSNGVVIDGTVEYNQEIIEAATAVAKTIASNGFINLQFIESEKGYKLTDVNARFCGSQVMSFGAGVNFPHLFIQYNILKEYVSVSPKWNTRMIRYWESCFFND
ncbi:ATP-grasp domain-containing protein [Peribacillus saganii]|uniref:ATP-grasp domain-containing protein n=1 Tax=Peribacillus saganii TaxID=2303992 RepID=A0A372LL86_9BACI|nr:ATP-grasp domain-containing protein [Peribacillus saganii]RFU67121.1 ATP-grasp domain-containing protein [Peribacillus saganii]